MSRALLARLTALRATDPVDTTLVAAYELVLADLGSRPTVGQAQARALETLAAGRRATADVARALALSVTRAGELLASLADRGLAIQSDGWWYRTAAAAGKRAGGRPAATRTAVLNALTRKPLGRDELVEATGATLAAVSSALTALRSAGLVTVSDHLWSRREHRFPTPAPVREDGGASFACQRKALRLAVAACLDDFREAHLQLEESSPCWRCPQGATQRLVEAWDLPVTPARVEAVIEYATKSDSSHLGRVPAWALAELGISDDEQDEEDEEP